MKELMEVLHKILKVIIKSKQLCWRGVYRYDSVGMRVLGSELNREHLSQQNVFTSYCRLKAAL